MLLRSVAEDRGDLDLRDWPRAMVSGLSEAGLGPVLRRLTQYAGPTMSAELEGADLTARLLTQNTLDATEEILHAAGPAAKEIILLKGMAACQLHYPAPHLRPMGDIDLLAPPPVFAALQAILYRLGYQQRSTLPAEFFKTHHHAMPFYHPAKRVWIDVHSGLFPSYSHSGAEACFSSTAVMANAIPMTFRGIETRQLRAELHLVYTCSHWGREFNIERGLIPIIDVLYLLRAEGSLDWILVQRLAATGYAGRYLALMIGYLVSHGLCPAGVTSFARSRPIGRFNSRILYRIIDRYFVERRPCGRVFTDSNLNIVWDALLRDRPWYANLVHVPFALLFPPRRTDRFRPLLALRRAWSMIRGRGADRPASNGRGTD